MADELKSSVLRWQRVPKEYWTRFALLIPSDAGTGAVKTAVEMILQQYPEMRSLGVEKLSWPVYRAIARMSRIDYREFPIGALIDEPNLLPIYQAGPMNTTGRVQSGDHSYRRAAAAQGQPVLLDRAYSGFEFAHQIETLGYDEIMRRSFETQIQPYIKNDVPFWLAIGPTKAFGTFALRPCGLLLIHTPKASAQEETNTLASNVTRARGSSFEHPVTRAFVKAMIQALPELEREHAEILKRLCHTEKVWQERSAGTPIASLFSDAYAGLFRNPEVAEESKAAIYEEHLYPVFTPGRCRLNITGLPDDEGLAKLHVEVFARHCRV